MQDYFLDIKPISGAFFVLNQIGFGYKNYPEFVFVLEFGNGEESREKEEGRKCFTFFRLFLISSFILPENEVSIVYWKCFCDCLHVSKRV